VKKSARINDPISTKGADSKHLLGKLVCSSVARRFLQDSSILEEDLEPTSHISEKRSGH